jgi:hypothetical protein
MALKSSNPPTETVLNIKKFIDKIIGRKTNAFYLSIPTTLQDVTNNLDLAYFNQIHHTGLA